MVTYLKVAIGALCIVTAAAPGQADVITFGTSDIPILLNAGLQTEGQFQYQALSGAWEVNGLSGDPPNSLYTFFNSNTSADFPFVGQQVEITSPGNRFRFDSVDFRTALSSGSDDVLITGLLGGTTVGTLALTSSSTVFQTVASPFSGDVDKLLLELTFHGSNGMALDNFVVNVTGPINPPPPEVPEPSSMLLLAMGSVGLLGGTIRRRRTTANPPGAVLN